MKKIKNIVVATDFTVTARNAYRYARALAKSSNAALTVVHANVPLVSVSDALIASPHDDERVELMKDLQDLVPEEDAATPAFATDQRVEIKVLSGEAEDVLIELSQKKNTDLIVIGTTGLADVLTKLFGSTSLNVSNKAHCPVIIVPRDTKWKPIEQILFASNFDSMTSELSQHIIDFALAIKADVHFVNVRNYDPILENRQEDINWDELFVQPGSELTYEKHTIYGNNTAEELTKYAEGKNIGLMAFASKHRNFWQNLVHTSITESMALDSVLPILVMHSDDKKIG